MSATTPTVQASPANCPRCGADNRCALTAGIALEHCWCRGQPATLPLPASADAACYCADCLRVLRETPHAR